MNTKRMRISGIVRGLFAIFVIGVSTTVTHAISFTIDGITYVPTTTTETISVGSFGMQTAVSNNQYTGYVLITGSGSWSYFFSYNNDLLYAYNPSSIDLIPMYFSTSPITQQNHPYIAPYDGIYPAYDPSHTYSLIANLQTSDPSFLYMGVGDSYWGDNVGSLSVQITQLQPVSVPDEGRSGLLFGACALALLVLRRVGVGNFKTV